MKFRVALSLFVAVALLAVLAVSPWGSAQAGDGVVRTGQFNVNCSFSHQNNDDMIVFPGQPGASHTHGYIGARGVNANTTLATLGSEGSTCDIPANLSAYWFTMLKDNGTTVVPDNGFVYYRAGNKQGPIQPFPKGLKVIAGKSTATGTYVNEAVISTARCLNPGKNPVVGSQLNNLTFAYCGSPTEAWRQGIQTEITFPDCWDGANLDSADHKSHMAYATGGQCPSTHPVPVPRIQVIARYKNTYGGQLSFTSGPTASNHADYVANWQDGICGTPSRLQELLDTCLNANQDCGNVAA